MFKNILHKLLLALFLYSLALPAAGSNRITYSITFVTCYKFSNLSYVEANYSNINSSANFTSLGAIHTPYNQHYLDPVLDNNFKKKYCDGYHYVYKKTIPIEVISANLTFQGNFNLVAINKNSGTRQTLGSMQRNWNDSIDPTEVIKQTINIGPNQTNPDVGVEKKNPNKGIEDKTKLDRVKPDYVYTPPKEIKTIFGKINAKNALPDFTNKLYGLAIGLAYSASILIFTMGGIFYITSGGNPDSIKNAKLWMYGALAGLSILVLAKLIFKTIGIIWLK